MPVPDSNPPRCKDGLTHGGLLKLLVVAAANPLMMHFCKPSIMLSKENILGAFDSSLAFDMVDPKIALAIFKHLGMPLGWSRLLNGLWTNQHPLLQFDHECSPSYENVRQSLPQGDPWSMAAMTFVFVATHIHSIAQTLPGTQTITFVDDRAVICDIVASCMEATQHWNMWSATLGLKENPNKEQFYHQTARGRAEFSQHDVKRVLQQGN